MKLCQNGNMSENENHEINVQVGWPLDAGANPSVVNQIAVNSLEDPQGRRSGYGLLLGYMAPPALINEQDIARFRKETGDFIPITVHAELFLPTAAAEDLWEHLGNVLGKNG